MNQQCQVVMLPTTTKAKYGDLILTPKHPQKLLIFEHQKCTEVAQDLYLTSNEAVKVGDWIMVNKQYIRRVKEIQSNKYFVVSENNAVFQSTCRKIVATIDVFLNLPLIPDSFVQAYIKAYNDGTTITEVAVEYEVYHGINTSIAEIKYIGTKDSNDWHGGLLDFILKLREDNTVIIHRARTYTREEVIQWYDYVKTHTVEEAFDYIHNKKP